MDCIYSLNDQYGRLLGRFVVVMFRDAVQRIDCIIVDGDDYDEAILASSPRIHPITIRICTAIYGDGSTIKKGWIQFGREADGSHKGYFHFNFRIRSNNDVDKNF